MISRPSDRLPKPNGPSTSGQFSVQSITRLTSERMTLKEFLAKLAATPRDWRLDDGLFIRRGNPSQDPISHFGIRGYRRTELWRYAAMRLGLLADPANRIMESADGKNDALRKKLLKACGVKPGARQAAYPWEARVDTPLEQASRIVEFRYVSQRSTACTKRPWFLANGRDRRP